MARLQGDKSPTGMVNRRGRLQSTDSKGEIYTSSPRRRITAPKTVEMVRKNRRRTTRSSRSIRCSAANNPPHGGAEVPQPEEVRKMLLSRERRVKWGMPRNFPDMGGSPTTTPRAAILRPSTALARSSDKIEGHANRHPYQKNDDSGKEHSGRLPSGTASARRTST